MDDGEWEDILGSGAVLVQRVRRAGTAAHRGEDDDAAASEDEARERDDDDDGEGDVHPEYMQMCLVHVSMRYRTDAQGAVTFLDTRGAKGEPLEVAVGDQLLDVLPPGMMLVLRMMGVGDVCRVKMISRYAYGPDGYPAWNVPPDVDVESEVEMLQLGERHKQPPEMALEELLRTTKRYKNRGNEFFAMNELDKALRCYKEGARYGDSSQALPPGASSEGEAPQQQQQEGGDERGNGGEAPPAAPQQQQQQQQDVPVMPPLDPALERERIACVNNMATVLERQGKLKESKESTIQVIAAEPRNLKALLRAARICTQQAEFEEATAVVQAALETDAQNPLVREAHRALKAKMEHTKQVEKERWGGFLKPVARQGEGAADSSDAPVPKSGAPPEVATEEKEGEATGGLQNDDASRIHVEPARSEPEAEEEITADVARASTAYAMPPPHLGTMGVKELGAISDRRRLFQEVVARLAVLLAPSLCALVAFLALRVIRALLALAV